MRQTLTTRQSWIFFFVVLAIIVIATVLLGFVVNTPTSIAGLLSLGAFALFLLLVLILSFYYRQKRKKRG